MSVMWYLCLFVSLQCPGGLLAGLIPASLRPLVCTKTVEHRIYTTKRDAHQQVHKVGCGASPRLFFYDGFRKWEKDITCSTKLSIEGEKPEGK